jgi:hypothetical protein
LENPPFDFGLLALEVPTAHGIDQSCKTY